MNQLPLYLGVEVGLTEEVVFLVDGVVLVAFRVDSGKALNQLAWYFGLVVDVAGTLVDGSGARLYFCVVAAVSLSRDWLTGTGNS